MTGSRRGEWAGGEKLAEREEGEEGEEGEAEESHVEDREREREVGGTGCVGRRG